VVVVRDKNNNTQGQYWVHYRNIHAKDAGVTLRYSNVGFINAFDNTSLIKIPVKGDLTTQIFVPTHARSLVMKYGKYGILYQEYVIEEFGVFTIIEAILLDVRNEIP
jgi:hypothetical protein